ncbi:MAG: hypothetical protein BAJATHORv1_50218 [Candidatus Thorarchaeota archaeon]|nr:MAG: hypothetical protein BAJATHORv1_50218 [Candidatus Thorarchaeota archaeon]
MVKLKQETLTQSLEVLGLTTGDTPNSDMLILQAMLLAQNQGVSPLTSKIVHRTLLQSFGSSLSRAWVQRTLKKMEDLGLVKTETEGTYRKHYSIDINSIVAGFERLRQQHIALIQDQKGSLDKQLQFLNELNCSQLAKEFLEFYTDKEHVLSARFLKGIDEIHHTIDEISESEGKPGSTIRVILQWMRSILEGSENRMQKYLRSAMRGIEVKYLVGPELLKIDLKEDTDFPLEFFQKMIYSLAEFRFRNIPFKVRLYEGARTYSHFTIDSDRTVLIITENPMTAIYVTRGFNPDLIDNVCETFDEAWENAIPIIELPDDLLKRYDTTVSRELSRIIREIRDRYSDLSGEK